MYQNLKEPTTKVELVEGYGIYVTKRALDDAVDSNRNNATRLIRNLASIFFPDDELSKSNVSGRGKKHIALDSDIANYYSCMLLLVA